MTTGTQRRIYAVCTGARASGQQIVVQCTKQADHNDGWAGFSGAPLLDLQTGKVYGIFSGTGGATSRTASVTAFFTNLANLTRPVSP